MVINSATDNTSSHKQEKGELVWGGAVIRVAQEDFENKLSQSVGNPLVT